MKNNNKYFIKVIIFSCLIILFTSNLFASVKLNFMSLKNNKVYLRQGPSFEHPIKLIYKKKYLPVEILDKSSPWRQIRDFNNNYGWIHISQLSKRKSGININKNSIMYKKPTIYSRPMAKLEIGRLVIIKKCKNKWCKIKSGNYVGWILRDYLWGNI